MPEAIQMRIAHQTNGRTRLVATDTVASADLIACSNHIAKADQVRVEARPASRSLVINHVQPWTVLEQTLAEAGIIVVPQPANSSPIDQTTSVLKALNDGLGRATGGRLDAVNIAFLVLVIGGFLQMKRGNLGGPAATLFTQALSIALLHGHRSS